MIKLALTARFLAFADNDTTSDAEKVLTQMMKVPDVSEYLFVGDGPYSTDSTKWINMMKKYFDTPEKLKKLRLSQGNHEHKESESQKAEDQIEEWLPHLKNSNDQLDWLSAGQVGNVYVISGNTQDLDVEFARDQFNYIKGELEKAKQLRAEGKIDWIILLFHKPFFTLKSSHSPYTAVRFLYKDIFRDAQVDFVLHGHNHNTQLWLPMVPSDSTANGEGSQLFTYKEDGKTFDFVSLHGPLYIICGNAGHEHNSINDSGSGVKNVMFYNDTDFGYTQLDFDGKKANVKNLDATGKILYEYNVSREGSDNPPPTPCLQGQCKDPITKQCRTIGINEIADPITGECKVKDNPPPTEDFKCPEGYWHYEPELGHCLPDLNPPNIPKCPEGYTWNPIKKVCEKDDNNPPPPPPPPPIGEPVAKLSAPSQVQGGQNVLLDGSQSIADTLTITQTIGQTVNLIDAGVFKKSFTAPNGNFSLGFQAVATKGTKQSVIQIAIQVSINNPPPPPPPPPGDEFDPHGTILLTTKIGAKTTGKKVTMEVGSNHRNGQRYNVNHKFINYMGLGYIKTSPHENKQSCKLDGPNHGSCKQLPQCCWMDTEINLDDARAALGAEYPHPDNHDAPAPSAKTLGINLKDKWIGWGTINYTNKEGWREHYLYCNPTPFLPDGKPNNATWTEMMHEIDKGQITTPELAKRKIPIDFDNGLEYELRCQNAGGDGHGDTTDMKWFYVWEIEPPSSS